MNRIDHDTEEAVRRFLTLIAGRFNMAGAIVYGSRARGTHRRDSDADVAVLVQGEHQRRLKTALEMADVAFDVLLETGINIAPLPIWVDEWEHPENHSNPALLYNIAREGIRLTQENTTQLGPSSMWPRPSRRNRHPPSKQDTRSPLRRPALANHLHRERQSA